MNLTETAELMRIRRDLTGGTYNDETISAWQEALQPWSLKQCRDALTTASRDRQRITVAHLVEHLPSPPREWKRAEEPICIRCGLLPAERLRTRCEYCQTAVDEELAQGKPVSAAMAAAVAAAHHRGQRSLISDQSDPRSNP